MMIHATAQAGDAVQRPVSTRGGYTLLDLGASILRHARAIVLVVMLAAVAAVVFVLLRPRTYTTTFSFIPQSTVEPARAGLAGLAGQFGLAIPSAVDPQSPQLYADLLATHAVLGPIAGDSFALTPGADTQVPLADALEVADAPQAERELLTVRALRSEVMTVLVATRTTGTITVRVRTQSAHLSQQLAERLLAGLNAYNLETRQSQAGKEREFIGKRLEGAERSLREAEDALERFLRSNRMFENSPPLMFTRDRLQREVLLQQQLVTGLSQQYEEARIREVRDIPVITLIDPPREAALPDSRGGVFTLLVVLFGATFVMCAWAVLSDEMRRARETEHLGWRDFRQEWRRLIGRAP